MSQHDLLVYAHIGDLHLTDEVAQNHADLAAIVSDIADNLKDGIDFVYLPGDNAENGLSSQYELAARELARLPMPVHIVTGDHDMEPGSLDNFYRCLGAAPLPKSAEVGGVRCLFLDICGPGKGGPDFRVGLPQSQWLADELECAKRDDARCAIFMHTYPADLKGPDETATLDMAFASRAVLLVDMGHTHYNELANDGRTIYAATRSTGQIEEGPVGYSITTIDHRVVSWRFRKLGDLTPIVLVTAPADRRLATDADDGDHRPDGHCEVRASVIGPNPIVRCLCTVDGGAAYPMRRTKANRFALSIDLDEGPHTIEVAAEDAAGAIGRETIEIATAKDFAAERHADGSDADAIGAWEARGIFGTQLGPNRNGRHW